MTTAQDIRRKVIEAALSQVGTSESPAGSNNVLYNTWFYGKSVRDGYRLDGTMDKKVVYPWCGTFVSWVFAKIGRSLGNIGYLRGYASCPYAVSNLHKWGKEVAWPDALPGDIGFFDFDGNGTFDHTGIFEAHGPDKTTGIFIEGNTGIPKSATDFKTANANGGIVMRRDDRHYQPGRIIIIRPNIYDAAA
jgi:hypothetical protein